MSEYIAWDDCVARYGEWDIFPTEWRGFPIHHTDPFWNADLFDEPPYQEFIVNGPDFVVRGDWGSNGVRLHAYANAKGLLLMIQDRGEHRGIWLEPETLKAFQDHINTTK